MSTHTIHYNTYQYEDTQTYGFETASACPQFQQALDEEFLQFAQFGDPGIELYNKTKTREGKHTVTLEDEMEIEYCPFCGAELTFTEREVIDER